MEFLFFLPIYVTFRNQFSPLLYRLFLFSRNKKKKERRKKKSKSFRVESRLREFYAIAKSKVVFGVTTEQQSKSDLIEEAHNCSIIQRFLRS